MAATLQRKCSGGINFVILTKIITKIFVPRNYFVIISARMVIGLKRDRKETLSLWRFSLVLRSFSSKSRPINSGLVAFSLVL